MDPRSGQGLSSPPREPSEHELRVQLEGAWEVLEQARDRHAALLERLESRRWVRQLRAQPELMWRTREQEGALREALERAEHRLQVEAPPEHHPLRVLLRQLRDQRSQMERFVHKRLAWLGERGDRSLLEGLERLETAVFVPLLWPPDKDEPVLLSGGPPRWLLILCGFFCGLFAFLATQGASWVMVPVGYVWTTALVMLQIRNARRYWLTPRRLVWKRVLGGMRQMPLESIHPDTITHPPGLNVTDNPLRVQGARRVTFSRLQNLELLEILLRMHCGPSLRGRRLGPPTYPLAFFRATRGLSTKGPDAGTQPGLIVIRSGQLAFLPDQRLYEIRNALFGIWPRGLPVDPTLYLMMQQLALLPAEDFDRCVATAVHAGGGESWPTSAVTYGPAPAGREYRFTVPQGPVFTGVPEAVQLDVIARLLPRGHDEPVQEVTRR